MARLREDTIKLSLNDARNRNRIDDFVAQEEALGIGPIDRTAFDGAVMKVIREPQSEDQTSHSACDGNSTGTKTPRDTG